MTLIHTHVRTCGAGRPFKDVRIHLITAPDILGPWSDPILLNATKLSDDYGQILHFTGAMVGVCAQDLNGSRGIADFDYFTLQARTEDD